MLSVAIAAYGAWVKDDRATAERCWSILLENPFGTVNLQAEQKRVASMEALDEVDWMNTNEASQWSLNTIIALELIAESLPARDGGAGDVADAEAVGSTETGAGAGTDVEAGAEARISARAGAGIDHNAGAEKGEVVQ